MAGEVHTRPSNETAPVTDKRPNIILFLWMIWVGRTSCLSGHNAPATTTRTIHPIWNVWQKQGKMFTQAYACSISSLARQPFTGMNAARHRVTSWTLRKNTTHEQPDSVMIYPEWNVSGICQEPVWNAPRKSPRWHKCSRTTVYHTIHCGKAHFGANDTPGPIR